VSRARDGAAVHARGGTNARLTRSTSTSTHGRRAVSMNQLHEGLRLYRTELRDAIDADLRGRPNRLRSSRRVRLTVPAFAVAVAAVAAVAVLASHGKVQTADAAVLRHVAAALTPQPGTILHERALVTIEGQVPQVFELWARPDGGAYRVIK